MVESLRTTLLLAVRVLSLRGVAVVVMGTQRQVMQPTTFPELVIGCPLDPKYITTWPAGHCTGHTTGGQVVDDTAELLLGPLVVESLRTTLLLVLSLRAVAVLVEGELVLMAEVVVASVQRHVMQPTTFPELVMGCPLAP